MSEPQNFNILIVDDDTAIVGEYNYLLKKEGFRLWTAKNRVEAQPYIDRFRLDADQLPTDITKVLALAIIDQNLKDPDPRKYQRSYAESGGIPFTALLRAASPVTRILVYSAHKGTPQDEGFAFCRAGADDYLKKVEAGNGDFEGFRKAFVQRVKDELAFFDSSYRRKLTKS